MYRDFSNSRSFADFTLERSEGLRMTNECNSLLTMGLRDARKISHTLIKLPYTVGPAVFLAACVIPKGGLCIPLLLIAPL